MGELNKKPNIKVFLYLILGICIFFLGFIAVNEYTIQSGEDLYLESAPRDPRDPLRGDYVILRYKFERSDILKDFFSKNDIDNNTSLYALFETNNEGVGILKSISKTKPNNGLFLKIKKIKYSNIETGIGKFFVPEGTGRKIERIRSGIIVHTKVDKFGSAQIIDLYYDGEKIDPKDFNL